jgi:hypothetical protein
MQKGCQKNRQDRGMTTNQACQFFPEIKFHDGKFPEIPGNSRKFPELPPEQKGTEQKGTEVKGREQRCQKSDARRLAV